MVYLLLFGFMAVTFVIIAACFVLVFQHWTDKTYYRQSRRTTQPSTKSEQANGDGNDP